MIHFSGGGHIWRCSGLILALHSEIIPSRIREPFWASNPGHSHARQASYLQYYYSIFFYQPMKVRSIWMNPTIYQRVYEGKRKKHYQYSFLNKPLANRLWVNIKIQGWREYSFLSGLSGLDDGFLCPHLVLPALLKKTPWAKSQE